VAAGAPGRPRPGAVGGAGPRAHLGCGPAPG